MHFLKNPALQPSKSLIRPVSLPTLPAREFLWIFHLNPSSINGMANRETNMSEELFLERKYENSWMQSYDFYNWESAERFLAETKASDPGDPSETECYRQFGVVNLRKQYFRLDNIAFSLIFLKRFDEAEEYLRVAMDMIPQLPNAHKNLGVILEHRGQYKEAAERYFRGFWAGAKDRICALHLKRLIDRQPSLRNEPILRFFMQEYYSIHPTAWACHD